MERHTGLLPCGCASAGWGLLTAPPCAGSKRARVVRAPLWADPPARRRSIGAPVSGLPGRQSQSVAVRSFCFCSRFCGHDGRPMGPLGRGESATDSPKGRAQDARVFFASAWMRCRKTPATARAPGGQDARKARTRGAFSLGYLSLGKQRKVTRRPEGPAKALALQRPEEPAKAVALQTRKTPTTLAPSTQNQAHHTPHKKHPFPTPLPPSSNSPTAPATQQNHHPAH
jgi:hypothetical protein